MTQYRTICLIVAAGSGSRLHISTAPDIHNHTKKSKPIPKQYLPVSGIAMLRHTCMAFLSHIEIDKVCVIFNPQDQKLYDKAVGDLDLLPPVAGGKIRQESVYLGLKSVAQFNPKKILIHDAARPLVDHRIISDIVHELDNNSGVIPTLPATDTLKKCRHNRILKTLPRKDLYYAQTPQGFSYNEIYEAHQEVLKNAPSAQFTDDASIFEYLQKKVSIVPGSKRNFKITTYEDLKIAEALYDSQL